MPAVGEPGGPPCRVDPGAGVYSGKFHGYWYAFGDYDVYALIEAPDNVAAATLL